MLSKILANIIKPLNNDSQHRLRNTYEFVDSYKSHILNSQHENGYICSYDVKSLYTKVPMHKALQVVMEHMTEEPDILDSHKITPEAFHELTKYCIENSYFEYNHSFHRQLEGGPMGSALTVELAEKFMQRFEENAIAYAPIEVPFWKRFVDDGLADFDKEEDRHIFLDYINGIDPAIQFTIELPDDKGLPYLDTFIHSNQTISIYRKATHTDKYLHYSSCQPHNVKKGVIISLVDRALKICDATHLDKELSHISEVLSKNGYPKL